jgi:hypothetical protein
MPRDTATTSSASVGVTLRDFPLLERLFDERTRLLSFSSDERLTNSPEVLGLLSVAVGCGVCEAGASLVEALVCFDLMRR